MSCLCTRGVHYRYVGEIVHNQQSCLCTRGVHNETGDNNRHHYVVPMHARNLYNNKNGLKHHLMQLKFYILNYWVLRNCNNKVGQGLSEPNACGVDYCYICFGIITVVYIEAGTYLQRHDKPYKL